MAAHYGVLSWWEPTSVTTATVLTADMASDLIALGIENAQASLGDRSEDFHRALDC
jgi:hypothetical protein